MKPIFYGKANYLKTKIFLSILAVTIAIIPCIALANNDWTALQGNPAHTGFVEIKTDPAKFHVLWSKTLILEKNDKEDVFLGNYVGMVVGDHIAFIALNNMLGDDASQFSSKLIAVNVNNGEIIWQNKTRFCKTIVAGIPALAYDNNEILVTASENGACKIKLYQAQTGLLSKEVYLEQEKNLKRISSIIASHDNIYIGGESVNEDILYSINRLTGQKNWTHSSFKLYLLSEPTISDNYILQPSKKISPEETMGVEAVDYLSGHSLFKIEEPSTELPYSQGGRKAYPVLDEHYKVAYYTTGDMFQFDLTAYDLEKRKIKWTAPFEFTPTQPVVAGDDVYYIAVSPGNQQLELHAINAADGKTQWKWHSLDKNDGYIDNLLTDPVATKDLIFIPGNKKTFAISRKTHEKVWDIALTGQLVIADNILFITEREISRPKNMADQVKVTAIALK